jgi:2-polyprenyl-3-methyl-5-hydroxy-6-metoxy-1,4-benzoquinol methylase
MKFSSLGKLKHLVREGREVLRRSISRSVGTGPIPLPGQFQTYNYTLPDRYPWLFQFAAASVSGASDLRLLSFGCSRGDEVLTLRKYFPNAAIKGIDVDPANIAHCQSRLPAGPPRLLSFATAATTESEETESFDAIFCLAVLCRGDLTTAKAQVSSPSLLFENFETIIADFARCLKPGGLLFLHTTNFRFCDAACAAGFDTVLEAAPAQLATDAIFDRANRLMKDYRYSPVGFRKRHSAARQRL